MKTLIIGNQKGGVGKTSTVAHLAFYYKEMGLRVAALDLDPQANLSFTLEQYKSKIAASDFFSRKGLVIDEISNSDITLFPATKDLADLEKSEVAETCKAFKERIDEISPHFDVCIVDTAPSLGIRMIAALFVADYVISPIELETFSIMGIKSMITTIANMRKVNPSITFLGMMPSKVDTRNARHMQHLKELSGAYPGLVMPCNIGLRSSIADALSLQRPVWTIKRTAARAAAKELKALGKYVSKKMEFV